MTGPSAGERSPRTLVNGCLDRTRRRLVESMPSPVKRRLAGPYNRLLVARADREFRGRLGARPDRVPADDAPRHVVLVVVDALRNDAVTRSDSPFLAERWRRPLVATAPWTFPAVASILTGRYPHEHGAIRGSDRSDTGSTDLVVPPKPDAEAETLPEAVATAGYDTYGGFAFHMPFFALGGRFRRHAVYDKADAAAVLGDYREWVGARADARTFAYIHLGDLHEPVDPPAPYWERYGVDASIPDVSAWDYVDVGGRSDSEAAARYRRHRKLLYRAALACVDDRLARLHRDLTARLSGDVLFVVTADHGEAFWEHARLDAEHFVDSRPAHCVDHGGTPFESLTRVPLAVDGLDFPVSAGGEDGRASAVDLAPTLLDALGLDGGLDATGASLRRPVPPERIALVESARYGHERKAAYLDEWKLVVSRGDDARLGFRLPTEEPETLPRSVERRLLDALPAFPNGERADVRVRGLAEQRLEDLGYV